MSISNSFCCFQLGREYFFPPQLYFFFLREAASFEEAQPVCIADDRYTGSRHGCPSDQRVEQQSKEGEENPGCDRNAQRVVDEGAKQALLGITHGCPGNFNRIG